MEEDVSAIEEAFGMEGGGTSPVNPVYGCFIKGSYHKKSISYHDNWENTPLFFIKHGLLIRG
jgi:hypothetical protein